MTQSQLSPIAPQPEARVACAPVPPTHGAQAYPIERAQWALISAWLFDQVEAIEPGERADMSLILRENGGAIRACLELKT